MPDYYYKNDRFFIDNFDRKKTFSNFLPAVAGETGIPMWVFYVNRGQGIAGFGLQDKNHPIMEFCPGSIALSRVNYTGFRTFLRIGGENYEPFGVRETGYDGRTMETAKSEFSITEVNVKAGYELKVTYFGLPGESFCALVRSVELKNISGKDLEVDICDGLSELLPYGITNSEYKDTGNLMRSFMNVDCLESKIPLYRLKSSTFDTTEMEAVEKANFYMSFCGDNELLPPVIDPEVIFGHDNSLSYPFEFFCKGAEGILSSEQFWDDKVACGFSVAHKVIGKGESLRIATLIGNVQDAEVLKNKRIATFGYIDGKREESARLVAGITSEIETKTAFPLFDKYLQQSYLDNILRGGYPLIVPNKKDGFVYYVYSRKHGDLERDYNWFILKPEYYSCGEGNFRDVVQNRRNDNYFHPQIDDFNIKTIFNLLQLDGGNPLVVMPGGFRLNPDADINDVCGKIFADEKPDCAEFLSKEFSLGALAMFLGDNRGSLKCEPEEAREEILSVCVQTQHAKFGEGYWIDHFTYLIDLIESYLDIYPDRAGELFFEKGGYRYFNSPVQILPRKKRQTMTKKGVRRLNSLVHIDECGEWAVDKSGGIINTNLAGKMLNLILIKAASLDPQNIGIDMETNKPGWNDAMNGMPAIFGSCFAETIELKRLVVLLGTICGSHQKSIEVLPCQKVFFEGMLGLLREKTTPMQFYDRSNTLKEAYRNCVYNIPEGGSVSIMRGEALEFLSLLSGKLDFSIAEARRLYGGLYPTFISYNAVKYREDGDGVEVYEFERRDLPLFAEGIARSYKIAGSEAGEVYKKALSTGIYDKTLKVYKTSESLEKEDFSIGRIRVFNPGWLEREACFLHMTYKYLYGMLKAGLYEEFFKEMKTNFVPFMNPEIYGRSILENSSFIVSDVKSDKRLVGRGFQPRLSGASAEVLSMWAEMFLGRNIFSMSGGELICKFSPKLPAEFFDENDRVETTLLSVTTLRYINKRKINTYEKGSVITRIELTDKSGTHTVEGDTVRGIYAEKIRKGEYSEITAYFN